MRLITYFDSGISRVALEIEKHVVDLERVAEMAGWSADDRAPLSSARETIRLGADRLAQLESVAVARADDLRSEGNLRVVSETRLGPPVPDPEKIICLGLNYWDHAQEVGRTPPDAPMFFAKFANSLVGPTGDIVPPLNTRMVDYEAELAVVLGRPRRNIAASDAPDHVFGAMALNAVRARDLQRANSLWTGGKAIDTFAPCGPALVTLDEIGDLESLGLRTRVNGETVQDGTTASMIFGVADTIAFLSQIMTLQPGDIIATGTPAGVGAARDPKLFLNAGDIVEVEVDRIGVLRNRVAVAA